MTEEEIPRVEDDTATTVSAGAPTTTAPVGAPMASVEGGMHSGPEVAAAETGAARGSRYAEGGSLAKFEREKSQEKKAGKP